MLMLMLPLLRQFRGGFAGRGGFGCCKFQARRVSVGVHIGGMGGGIGGGG